MMRHACVAMFTALAIAALPGSAAAQKSVGTADLVKASATITAIDPATRMVTFRDDAGNEDVVQAPAEMKRFNEVKVGDRLNLSYYQSRVITLRKAGTPTSPTGTTGTEITKGTGALPAGLATRQTTTVVTLKSVNLNTGVITVQTEDGRMITRTVSDKSLLNGVVADDKLEITTTQAVLADFERP